MKEITKHLYCITWVLKRHRTTSALRQEGFSADRKPQVAQSNHSDPTAVLGIASIGFVPGLSNSEPLLMYARGQEIFFVISIKQKLIPPCSVLASSICAGEILGSNYLLHKYW